MSNLLQSIRDIPERHQHKRDELETRCNTLILAASIRPSPDPTRYMIARSLLSDVTKHIPRLAYQQRQALNIVTPLINPVEAREEEEERKKKEAEKANPWVYTITIQCTAMHAIMP